MKRWTLWAGLVVCAAVTGCSSDDGDSATTDGTTSATDGTNGSTATDGTDGIDGADGTDGDATGALTYYRDTKAIVDSRCATCHSPGDIGPFPLTTYEEVQAFAGAVEASVKNGTMPPWMPSDQCNTLQHSIDLTTTERETLLAWLDDGAEEGDPADIPAQASEPTVGFEADLSLQIPEPYAPTKEPDDYRCHLVEWPAEDVRYVTGLRVNPDQRAIVHHVIVFVATPDQVETFKQYDADEEGPGYTCYGGPTPGASLADSLADIDPATLVATLQKYGLTIADLQAGNVTTEQFGQIAEELGINVGGGFNTIGSWVPGVPNAPLPADTGIRVEPGSMLVVQVHYNTLSSAPVADQLSIEIATTDSVEKQATNMELLDIGWITNGAIGGEPMTIPAGEESVTHSTIATFDSMFVNRARTALGLAPDANLLLYAAGHHMHQLGVQQRTEIRHADGTSSCLLDIPNWDFNWQGRYTFSQPILLQDGDEIHMSCTWDNSAANQPVIDGQVLEPQDLKWGEGSYDEMCLGSYYVTAE